MLVKKSIQFIVLCLIIFGAYISNRENSIDTKVPKSKLVFDSVSHAYRISNVLGEENEEIPENQDLSLAIDSQSHNLNLVRFFDQKNNLTSELHITQLSKLHYFTIDIPPPAFS